MATSFGRMSLRLSSADAVTFSVFILASSSSSLVSPHRAAHLRTVASTWTKGWDESLGSVEPGMPARATSDRKHRVRTDAAGPAQRGDVAA